MLELQCNVDTSVSTSMSSQGSESTVEGSSFRPLFMLLANFEYPADHLGPFWTILEPFWDHFEPFWDQGSDW